MYAKVAELIPEHREKAKQAQVIKKNPAKPSNVKPGAPKPGAGGKGGATVPKKKKKGKR